MRGMAPDEARTMATRLGSLAGDVAGARSAALGAMIDVSRWHDPAWRLPAVASGVLVWQSRLAAASDTVERRTDLIEMLAAIAGAGGMESVRHALEAELLGTMEATVIDEVAPVIITGSSGPSSPNAGPDTNSQILHGTEETFRDEDGTLVQLLGDEVDWAVALDRAVLETSLGTFVFAAVGADAEATWWVGWSTDGFEAGASGAAEVYLVQGEYSLDTEYLQAGAQFSVGAEAEAVAAIELQPLEGDLRAELGAEAGVSASVGIEGTLGPEEANVSGAAEAGIGLGGEAKLDVGLDNGKFGFKTELGAYLGVGLELDLGFEIDVAAIGGGIIDAGGDFIDIVTNPGKMDPRNWWP